MKSIRSGKKSHEDDHELQPVRDDHHGTGPKIQQRSKGHPTRSRSEFKILSLGNDVGELGGTPKGLLRRVGKT